MKTIAVDGVPAVTTTELCSRLGFVVPSTMLKQLSDIQPLAETSTGIYWRESDVDKIAVALAAHLMRGRRQPRATWSSALVCGWQAWRVVDDGHLALELPANNCCDMRGAIKTAEALCPMVWRIDTYSGGEPDMVYFLDTKTGKWQARQLSFVASA